MMDSGSKPEQATGIAQAWDLLVFGFFSVLTVGILPMTFISMSRARRRRLKRFMAEGLPAAATITAIALENVGFDVKMARVHYEFGADGQVRRDADMTLRVIADRWRVGDRVEVLYLPDRDYDSAIVSG